MRGLKADERIEMIGEKSAEVAEGSRWKKEEKGPFSLCQKTQVKIWKKIPIFAEKEQIVRN